MSCQFTWNFNDYKTNENKEEEVDIAVLTSGVNISDVDNNVLYSTFGKRFASKQKGVKKNWQMKKISLLCLWRR